jgi:hypothetical protein
MHLHKWPWWKVASGRQLGVPVKISGTFADPTTSVAPLAAAQDVKNGAVGLTVFLAEEVPGGSSWVDKIGRAFGIKNSKDFCPASLSLARSRTPGPPAPCESPAILDGAIGPTPSGSRKILLIAIIGE